MKLLYTINEKGNVAVVEKTTYSTNVGVVSPEDPLVFCLQEDLVKYYPSKPQELLQNPLFPVMESPIIDVRASLQAHVDKGLMSADVLALLPVVS